MYIHIEMYVNDVQVYSKYFENVDMHMYIKNVVDTYVLIYMYIHVWIHVDMYTCIKFFLNM